MSGIEQLEQRKKELELERDIRRLERTNRIASWRWWWVAPIAAFGLVLATASLDQSKPVGTALGVILLVPAILKFFSGGR